MGENQQEVVMTNKLMQAMKNVTDRVKFAVASVLFLKTKTNELWTTKPTQKT